jgi:hypothetical protein
MEQSSVCKEDLGHFMSLKTGVALAPHPPIQKKLREKKMVIINETEG